MWNTFHYTIRSLIRERDILIWSIIFPLVLATLFNAMFSGLDELSEFAPIPVAIVEDDAYRDSASFSQLIEGIAAEGDDRMIEAHYVADADGAKALLGNGDVEGYIVVDSEGTPALFITESNTLSTTSGINQTILKSILDRYLHTQELLGTIGDANPLAFADPSFERIIESQGVYIDKISITANESSSTVRYNYALLGFASIMTANVGMAAITRTQANLSALGARRAVGATSRSKTLIATLGASWLLAFACLLVAFFYMRFVLAGDFGGRDLYCILGLGVASLMSTALGSFIGAIPKMSEGAKNGILTGLSCMLAMTAGLFGEWSQKLGDELARNAPVLQLINPSRQVANLFYSLFYYDTYTQFASTLVVLLVMAAVLFGLAALFMRRQRYASI